MHQAHLHPSALLGKREILGTDGRPGLLNVGNTTFYELIAAGKLPRPVKVGTRSLWRAGELLAAIERLAQSSEG
jgi:hypothetical protein